MSKLLLVFLAFFSFNYAFAQPVLTAANINPVVGDVYKFNSLVAQVDTLQNGPNVTWDYSSLVPYDTGTIVATTTVGTGIPSADIRFLGPPFAINYYYKFDLTKFEYAGLENPTGINIYTDPEILLNFPFQYNDSFSDFLSSNWPGPSQFQYGTVYSKADGYGTLILPTGTYTNALRVKSNYYLKDSTPGFPATDFSCIMMRWYVPGIHLPIAYSRGYGNVTTPSFTFLSGITTGITEVKTSEFRIYPNPCLDILHINSTIPCNMTTATIQDYCGRIVLKSILKGKMDFELQLNSLTPGLYFLNITGVNWLYQTKIMKE